MKEADLKRLYIASIQLYNILEKTNQRIKKHKHHFVHEGLYSQSYGFSCSHAWMWELVYKESWAPKHWWFWTMVLEKTLESPLDCKEIQPVHPKGDQSWISLEGLMLKLKLQYFGHLMRRADACEKSLMLGKIEGRRKRGWQRMRWLDGITNSMDMSLSKLRSWWRTGKPGVLAVHGVAKSRTWLSDWNELNWALFQLESIIICAVNCDYLPHHF